MFVVICEDDKQRHDEPFETKADARKWAEWGHACTSQHEIKPVEAATADNPLVEAVIHALVDRGYDKAQVQKFIAGYVDANSQPAGEDGIWASFIGPMLDQLSDQLDAAGFGCDCDDGVLCPIQIQYQVPDDGDGVETYANDLSRAWVEAHIDCGRFASDEDAANWLGRKLGYEVAWAVPPDAISGVARPYLATSSDDELDLIAKRVPKGSEPRCACTEQDMTPVFTDPDVDGRCRRCGNHIEYRAN